MPPLHPLLRALRRAPMAHPSSEQMDAVFQAAAQGGLTAVEASVLARVLEQHADGWTSNQRHAWSRRMEALEVHPLIVRPRSPNSAQAEDLSGDVRVLWTQEYNSETQRTYVADLLRLAQAYDFELVLYVPPWRNVPAVASDLLRRTGMTPAELDRRVDIVKPDLGWQFSDWAEDNKILTNGDDLARQVRVQVPPTLSAKTLQLAELFTRHEGYHPFEPGIFQGAVSLKQENLAALKMAEAEAGRPSTTLKSYIEGGNLLPGTTSDGKPYALLGRDSLILSLFHLEETCVFTDAEVKQARSNLSVRPEELQATARTLLDMKRTLGVSTADEVGAVELEEATDFLALQQLTRKQVAVDLGIPLERVVYVTQPAFHIDMALRPLGPGEILVHHPDAALQLLEDALQTPSVKTWERRELEQMRRHAERERKERGAVYDAIIAELDAAGLIPVKVGGVFWSKRRGANFMNAIPGTTASGKSYYFTTGSSIAPLEQAFARQLEALGVDAVEFIARAGGSATSLSAGEQSIFDFGALDCREVHHRGRSGVTTDLLGAALGTEDNPASWS